ncbi:MAG: NADH-quinone oxidoreductase subunit N [Phycisphaerales bacterium]|nr:NADH-quinone oxidoreductase subunit N [Phycisphaerales bacterium]
MMERVTYLYPEIALFITTCIVMIVGLSRELKHRKLCAPISGLGLLAAGVLATGLVPGFHVATGAEVDPTAGQILLPNLVPYAKVLVAGVGILLLLLQAGTVDRVEEARIASGRAAFNPLRSNRAEYYAFFLFSLTGLMLCASADDLIWLFLALELTSLPTYIMVTMSTSRHSSQEAGVKYFFLGALGAAVFLYGFTLLYGATGSTNLNQIHHAIAAGGLSGLSLAGMLLALLGVCFKIAAVPMHFYTADVYQGAASSVSAFLAFVPKTAGFIAILLLASCAGWTHGAGDSLPDALRTVLWVIAALTMTVGNVLAIWQNSVKRILAYSSIAHSGYMLVGVVAGPGGGTFATSGIAAVLFYLLCYGVMNIGTFGVLACLEGRAGADGEPAEIESLDDLRGLCQRHPVLGWTMVICTLSLLGLPPLLGFFGKVPLFTSAISAGEIPLVVVLGLNSAIAAFYYLRIVGSCLLEKPETTTGIVRVTPFGSRPAGALASAAGVIVLAIFGNGFMAASEKAAAYDGGHVEKKEPRAAGVPETAPQALGPAKAEGH